LLATFFAQVSVAGCCDCARRQEQVRSRESAEGGWFKTFFCARAGRRGSEITVLKRVEFRALDSKFKAADEEDLTGVFRFKTHYLCLMGDTGGSTVNVP
jgi:uncharacterized protein YmfQ (DUF2313 family)